MKVGNMDLHKIERGYYKIDTKIINGDVWALYEHKEYGEDVKAIAVNLTQSYYAYTYETLDYTVENLECDYFSELYSL